MKIKREMLAPETEPAELAKSAFTHIDGITDEWIEETEAKKVAGGQILLPRDAAAVASIAASNVDTSCCTLPVTN